MKKRIALLTILALALGVNVGFLIRDYMAPTALQIAVPKFQSDDSSLMSSDMEASSTKAFWESWVRIQANFVKPPDSAKLMQEANRGMVKSLGDRHTMYLNPEETRLMAEQNKPSYQGIGVSVEIDPKGMKVGKVTEGSPAERAGMLPGDLVTHVNGKSLEGKTLHESIALVRGPAGKAVKLTVAREDWAEPKTLSVVRAKIKIVRVKYSLIEKDGLKVAHIALLRFDGHAKRELVVALFKMGEDGAEKLILDLRDNPGGAVVTTQQLAALWIGEGLVSKIKGRHGGFMPVTGRPIPDLGATLAKVPTVILINKGSASASEMLSGCLQDHGKAIIVGETSYGKGSMQNVYSLSDGAQLRLTIALFYTPKGRLINGKGITPDHEVKLTADDLKANRDPQLDKALELLRSN